MGHVNPEPAERVNQTLLDRAHAALDVTPLSVAGAEGLDAAAVSRLRAGRGDSAAAARLARALRRHSAELRALATELVEAARRG